MAPLLLIAIRSEAGSSGQAAKGCACSFCTESTRSPTATVCRRAVEACTTTPKVLSRCLTTRPNGSSLPKRTSVSCACGNRCPSGTCSCLSRGKKPASTLWTGHIRAFHFHLLPSVRLPLPSRPSPRLQGLPTLLAHQSLASFTLGGGTGLRRLLDQLGSQAIQILVAKSKTVSQIACFMTRLKAEVRVCSGASPRSQLVSCTTLIAVAMATCPRCVLGRPK